MKKQWASGFTIVEIIIVVVLLGILVAVVSVGYGNVRKTAALRAAQSDLLNVATSMERERQQNNAYPTSLPSDFEPSSDVSLTLSASGAEPYYNNLSEVQEGMLFSDICSELIAEGVGKGVNQGGTTEDYITGCGNWNHDSMQFTGWVSKVWDVPVSDTQLSTYAQNFTTSNTWNKAAHEAVVKNFYGQMIERFEQRGGEFPIESFWDSWATPQNGGVIAQPLPSNPRTKQFFCIEAQITGSTGVVWHITEENKLASGSC